MFYYGLYVYISNIFTLSFFLSRQQRSHTAEEHALGTQTYYAALSRGHIECCSPSVYPSIFVLWYLSYVIIRAPTYLQKQTNEVI